MSNFLAYRKHFHIVISRIYISYIHIPMTGNQNPVILRFDEVSFAYNDGKHPILVESDFSIRQNTKITIMGQN